MSKRDMFDAAETGKRLEQILKGAFSSPPTALKAIPKKNGEKREGARKASPARVIQSKSMGS